jgi:hypothetical protein
MTKHCIGLLIYAISNLPPIPIGNGKLKPQPPEKAHSITPANEREDKMTEKKRLINHITIDGIKMRITKDTITAEGYQSWIAVRYMTTNEDRLHCAKWVRHLIQRGTIEKVQEN